MMFRLILSIAGFLALPAYAHPTANTSRWSLWGEAGGESLELGHDDANFPIYGYGVEISAFRDAVGPGTFDFGTAIAYRHGEGELDGRQLTTDSFAAGPKFCYALSTGPRLCDVVGIRVLQLAVPGIRYSLGSVGNTLSIEQKVGEECALRLSVDLGDYRTGGRESLDVSSTAVMMGVGWSPDPSRQ